MSKHPLSGAVDFLNKRNLTDEARGALRLDRAQQIVHEHDLKQYKAALRVVKYYEQRYGKPK